MKKLIYIALFCCLQTILHAQSASPHLVSHVKITIVSTMLAQEGIGDWGFGALVECDSSRILFDTGGRDHSVRDNTKELHINLSRVPAVVLSHGHPDHTAGWLSLRQELSKENITALSTTYTAPGFFEDRILGSGNRFSLKSDSGAYVASGGKIKTVATWLEVSPGVFLTGGDIPRVYPEKNYAKAVKRVNAKGQISQDTVREDMSMVIATQQGLTILAGCGHSGTMNLVATVRKHFPGKTIYAVIGGFHLLAATDQQIEQTAKVLRDAGVRYFMGAHCTGIEPVHQIMELANLKRNECIVGSVGASFDPAIGFVAGQLTMGNDKNAYFKK